MTTAIRAAPAILFGLCILCHWLGITDHHLHQAMLVSMDVSVNWRKE